MSFDYKNIELKKVLNSNTMGLDIGKTEEANAFNENDVEFYLSTGKIYAFHGWRVGSNICFKRNATTFMIATRVSNSNFYIKAFQYKGKSNPTDGGARLNIEVRELNDVELFQSTIQHGFRECTFQELSLAWAKTIKRVNTIDFSQLFINI